jgi:hypothetical protein
LVLPYFAKRQHAHDIERGLRAVHLFFGGLLVLLLALAAVSPGTLLWILGGGYQNLQAELLWLLAAAAMGAWGGTLYSIGCARGWVLPALWSAPVGILAMSLVGLNVDLSTVRGVLMVNAAATATALVLAAAYLEHNTRQLRRSAALADPPLKQQP